MGRAWRKRDSEFYRQMAARFRLQSEHALTLRTREGFADVADIYDKLATQVEECERYLLAMDWPLAKQEDKYGA